MQEGGGSSQRKASVAWRGRQRSEREIVQVLLFVAQTRMSHATE